MFPVLSIVLPFIAILASFIVLKIAFNIISRSNLFQQHAGIRISGKWIPAGAIKPKRIMTEAEWKMIKIIERHYPNTYIMAQVSFDGIIQAYSEGFSERQSIRARFSQKRADFVLIDRNTGAVVVIIELDDRSHNAEKDAERDAMTRMAGYKTIRVPSLRDAERTLAAAKFAQAA